MTPDAYARIGETLAVELRAAIGDIAQAETVTIAVARARVIDDVPSISSSAVRHAMTVTTRAAQPGLPEARRGELAPAVTATFTPGIYGADATWTVAGQTGITQRTLWIEMSRAA